MVNGKQLAALTVAELLVDFAFYKWHQGEIYKWEQNCVR